MSSEVTGAGLTRGHHPGRRLTRRGNTATSLTEPALTAHLQSGTAAASWRGNPGGGLALGWAGNTVVFCRGRGSRGSLETIF